MKISKWIALTGIVSIIALGSCKKYEDGPAISLKSKKERVANTWRIEQAFRNGEDVTSDYDEYTLFTQKDGDAELAALYSFGAFSYEYETQGTWDFESNNEIIAFDYQDNDADVKYQILRLEEDALWLREQGGEDELHLVSK